MLLIFLAVAVLSAQAFDFRDAIADIPGMEKCMPDFQMFDASGKLPSGIMSGNMLDLGNFDQCLQIENTTIPVKGQYCFVKLHFPPKLLQQLSGSNVKTFNNNFTDFFVKQPQDRMILQGVGEGGSVGIIMGWCLPHTCPVYELTAALSTILTELDPDLKITPLSGGMCQTKDNLVYEYDTNKILFITFLGATLFLMIVSTLYDMYLKYSNKKLAHIILIAFSVRTNGEKLLSTSKNADQLGCLNGIRFISMMWVIFGHRFSTASMEPNVNGVELMDLINKPAYMYIINAPLSVDSFFVLSGLLIGYTYCLAKEKGVKFNIIMFYIHRYLRLTPVLAVLVWFNATILDIFGSGPFWPFALRTFKRFCLDNWWSALLYAQNYYNPNEICLGQTWYLAVDMQLYILSPIILIPLWKWPKWTLIGSSILVLGSIAIPFAVSYTLELPAFTITAGSQDYMSKYYMTTHTRFGPWLMGLMLGYFLFKLKKNKNNRIRLHPAQVAFGWIVGMGLLLSTLFSAHDLMLHPDILGNSFFNALHRHGWTLGLCWVIYACTQGYGGPINAFLSWSVFQILAKFTYTIYLIHMNIQYLMLASTRTVTHFSDFRTMFAFWGDFMFSFAIAVCLTLAYESPMITIEKVIFKTGHKPKKPELPSHNPTNSQNKGFEAD